MWGQEPRFPSGRPHGNLQLWPEPSARAVVGAPGAKSTSLALPGGTLAKAVAKQHGICWKEPDLERICHVPQSDPQSTSR